MHGCIVQDARLCQPGGRETQQVSARVKFQLRVEALNQEIPVCGGRPGECDLCAPHFPAERAFQHVLNRQKSEFDQGGPFAPHVD